MSTQLMKIPEIAKILQISRALAYRLIEEGQLLEFGSVVPSEFARKIARNFF